MKSIKVDSILELIGNTPLIRINRMNPAQAVELFVKLESMNPGGSVKDRIGYHMIAAALNNGQLTPGKIVLEASSGNTAIGLAMACAVKGYRLMVTMAESASEERKKILRAYGAELVLTPGHLGTDGAIEEAYRMAREEPDRYFLVDQFNNEANWQAHYVATGREIWEATAGKVDVVVLTMGTTGTLMGTTRCLKELNPKIRVVGVEPFKGHKIQGLKNMKESYPPGIFKPEEPDAIVNIEDEEAYETARRLAREEGILVGMSSGAAMKVALDEAGRLGKGLVVALLPDGGERYLSTSLFIAPKVFETVHFYNTLTRQVDELKPITPGKIGIYSCGPSLDGPADLGLWRRLVCADILKRYLVYRGFEVKQVMNIGDIDDRTVNACLNSGQNLKEFTAHWEKQFFDDQKTLRITPANHYPKASEHIGAMIELTQTLLDKGLAYEKLRSIYFNINRFPEYGKLSRFNMAEVQSNTSTIYDYYEKENPRDFTLFKRTTLAELKAGIYWATKWGNARPGWHIECACMAARHLGETFDIHTASTDLIFPHGDNEIAIAEGIGHKPLANFWLHSEVVMAEGKKVSKSTHNVLTLKDLIEKGYDSKTVRFWLLSTHYRKIIKYSESELNRARQSVLRFNELASRLKFAIPGQQNPDFDQLLYEARSSYHHAMDHDLNVPQALGHIFACMKGVNRAINEERLDASQIKKALEFLKGVDQTLAIINFEALETSADIEKLLTERNLARQSGDYSRADAIRDKLVALGYALIDTPAGSRLKIE